jgi:hypothetical protein
MFEKKKTEDKKVEPTPIPTPTLGKEASLDDRVDALHDAIIQLIKETTQLIKEWQDLKENITIWQKAGRF